MKSEAESPPFLHILKEHGDFLNPNPKKKISSQLSRWRDEHFGGETSIFVRVSQWVCPWKLMVRKIINDKTDVLSGWSTTSGSISNFSGMWVNFSEICSKNLDEKPVTGSRVQAENHRRSEVFSSSPIGCMGTGYIYLLILPKENEPNSMCNKNISNISSSPWEKSVIFVSSLAINLSGQME